MVKRLRRRPLTAETGVRFPMGLPKKHTTISSCVFCFTSDRVLHIALQAGILAQRGGVFFIALPARYSCKAGRGDFYCPASRYSCTAGSGVFYCPASPLFLHGGARCFLLRASRYSCTAGRGGFYCPASRGAFCMARCVVVIERQIEFFTASCTFYIGILHCTASLAFSLWKNTRLRKIFVQAGVFL